MHAAHPACMSHGTCRQCHAGWIRFAAGNQQTTSHLGCCRVGSKIGICVRLKVQLVAHRDTGLAYVTSTSLQSFVHNMMYSTYTKNSDIHSL